ncbi:MAG: hypothetical protein GXP24_10270 [Planctomycetes bacterium]|nr:hypothetical protein [Planctomycetota bacterium]
MSVSLYLSFRRVLSSLIGLLLVTTIGIMELPSTKAQDPRSFQHGIDLVPLPNGHYKLIWSSSGNPPTGANSDGSWPHDVYASNIDPANPQIVPTTLISRPEAQEPASSAITADGRIMVTMEDGWNAQNLLAQRYGVYDTNLNPVTGYPQLVLDGGHSGHVAAVENQFVVFYSEGWVAGGGVDDLGSGDDVYVSVYQSNGAFVRSRSIAVGNATRDWWPIVAGSNNHAMLLWQRFVDNETYSELIYSIYNPSNGSFVKTEALLATELEYYTYDVQYIESIDRFLAVGAYKQGGGFAYLIDDQGTIVGEHLALPEVVREGQPAIWFDEGSSAGPNDNTARVVYPKSDGGVMVLELTTDDIALSAEIAGLPWQTAGTDGIFTAEDDVYFVNLSPTGLIERTFQIEPVLLGDFDGDWDVDGTDFLVWQRAKASGADANGDGVVDSKDLAFWQSNFGEVGTETGSTAIVPESSSCLLALVGMSLALYFSTLYR